MDNECISSCSSGCKNPENAGYFLVDIRFALDGRTVQKKGKMRGKKMSKKNQPMELQNVLGHAAGVLMLQDSVQYVNSTNGLQY
jgi:hypothetical protein